LGGYAYFISGDLDKRHFDAAKAHKGFRGRMVDFMLDTLFNPKGEQSIQISSQKFINLKEKLTTDLVNYLKTRITNPIPASDFVLNSLGGVPIYLRGESKTKREPLSWSLIFRFSGCTGLCETSAAVSYHWTDVWIQDRYNFVIQELLEPFGFKNAKLPPLNIGKTFIPVQDGKYYASYLTKEAHEDLRKLAAQYNTELSENPFEIDLALFEDDDTSDVTNWKNYYNTLWKQYGELMSDGQCKCQLCSPNSLDSATSN
jgi:hypothetical protein